LACLSLDLRAGAKMRGRAADSQPAHPFGLSGRLRQGRKTGRRRSRQSTRAVAPWIAAYTSGQ
jgi:hypothetical protein